MKKVLEVFDWDAFEASILLILTQNVNRKVQLNMAPVALTETNKQPQL
jgi:hypothetical protein